MLTTKQARRFVKTCHDLSEIAKTPWHESSNRHGQVSAQASMARRAITDLMLTLSSKDGDELANLAFIHEPDLAKFDAALGDLRYEPADTTTTEAPE